MIKHPTAFVVLLFLITGLSACKKNTSEYVSITVLGRDSKGINGASVILYSLKTTSQGYKQTNRIFSGTSNADGVCDVGKVLEGEYKYLVYVQDGQKTYFDEANFQKIDEESKTITSKPFLNTGSVKLRVVHENDEPYSNINVALIPHPRYNSSTAYYFDDLMTEASVTGTTDADGYLTLEDVPSGDQFSVVVYYSSSNYKYLNYEIFSNGYFKSYTITTDL